MRFKAFVVCAVVLSVVALPGAAQEPSSDPSASQAETPKLSENEAKGVQIAESAILVYSNLQGRNGLDQIRKTWVEFGTLELTDDEGKVKKADYELRILRGESLEDAKIRLDKRFPDTRYALIYDGSKIFGLYGTTSFDPRNDAVSAFSNRVFHGIEGLLRYRESGAKVVFDRDDKVMGVDYQVVKVTTKEGQDIYYYVSKRSLRIMMLEFEQGGVKYRRKFYDYNYAQNTLFPYRTVLWADDKKIEEQKTNTVTFGQEFGDEYFSVG